MGRRLMARVPIVQGNRVQTRPEPRERFQFSAPRNFVGPALQQFGQQLGQAAQDFDAIEATYDEADALRIENEYRTYERERLRTGDNAYLATKGFVAGESMEPAVTDLRTGAENLLTGARSKRARDMAKRALDQRVGAAEETVAKHSLAEMTQARIGQSVARIGGAKEDAVETYGTDQFAVHLGIVEMETAELGRLQGWDSERVKDETEKETSAVHRSVAERLMVDDDIDGAMAYLDGFQEAMRFDDEMAVRRALKPKLEFREAEAAVDRVFAFAAPPVETEPGTEEVEGGVDNTEGANSQARLDPNAFFNDFTVRWEGEDLVTDSNGHHAKYGINAEFNPGVNVPGLSKGQAAQIFHDRYYKRSGADKLPPALAAVHVDTFYLNERQAQRILKESGGDPNRYIELRQDFLDGLAKKNPGKYGKYQKGWTNRTNALRKYAGQYASGSLAGSAVPRSPDGTVDTATLYSRLDEMAEKEGWTPEFAERVRDRMSVRVSRDDQVRSREQAAQWDGVLEQVDALDAEFTDISQINGYAELPADRRMQLEKMAETNRKGGVDANGDVAISLGVMAIEEPEKFAQIDLREYKAQITPAEFEAMRLKQSTIVAKPKEEVSIRSGISASIGYYATEEMDLTGSKNQDRKLRVMDAMENYLRGVIPDVGSGKRAPTDAEFRQAFDWATAKVVVGKGFFGGAKEKPRFERDYYSVPREDRNRISIAYRRIYGRLPTEDELVDYYEKNK